MWIVRCACLSETHCRHNFLVLQSESSHTMWLPIGNSSFECCSFIICLRIFRYLQHSICVGFCCFVCRSLSSCKCTIINARLFVICPTTKHKRLQITLFSYNNDVCAGKAQKLMVAHLKQICQDSPAINITPRKSCFFCTCCRNRFWILKVRMNGGIIFMNYFWEISLPTNQHSFHFHSEICRRELCNNQHDFHHAHESRAKRNFWMHCNEFAK